MRLDGNQAEGALDMAKSTKPWLQRAIIGVDTAKSQVVQREAERKAAVAVIAQREAELDAANRRLERSQQLVKTNTVSQQVLDDDRAHAQSATAAVNAAKAQLAAADAAVNAGRSCSTSHCGASGNSSARECPARAREPADREPVTLRSRLLSASRPASAGCGP